MYHNWGILSLTLLSRSISDVRVSGISWSVIGRGRLRDRRYIGRSRDLGLFLNGAAFLEDPLGLWVLDLGGLAEIRVWLSLHCGRPRASVGRYIRPR